MKIWYKQRLQSYQSDKVNVLNFGISSDTEGQLKPACEGNHWFNVLVDHFIKNIVSVSSPTNSGYYAINPLDHCQKSRYVPPRYVLTDRGGEQINA